MAIPPPAPLPHPLWQNFPMCPVLWQGRLKMAHAARLAFSSFLGPEKISSELDDRDLARGGGMARPYRCSGKVPVVGLWRDFFWTQVRREGNTGPIGSANTWSHFGPCNSLRCEMAPWRDWTSLTYVEYRSREISSKQYGAGQCQQISDVFLKHGRSFL